MSVNDLEITKRCAEAMGYKVSLRHWHDGAPFWMHDVNSQPYEPLKDGAEAFQLLYWLMERAEIILISDEFHCNSDEHNIEKIYAAQSISMLRRAICECVAKLGEVANG